MPKNEALYVELGIATDLAETPSETVVIVMYSDTIALDRNGSGAIFLLETEQPLKDLSAIALEQLVDTTQLYSKDWQAHYCFDQAIIDRLNELKEKESCEPQSL